MASKAHAWFDVDNVDLIIESTDSAAALAMRVSRRMPPASWAILRGAFVFRWRGGIRLWRREREARAAAIACWLATCSCSGLVRAGLPETDAARRSAAVTGSKTAEDASALSARSP